MRDARRGTGPGYDSGVADPKRRLPTNVAGDFFVDATCIDCDTCRWMAPATFDRAAEQARVHAQPEDAAAVRDALHALASCPTSSIGAGAKHDVAAAVRDFPLPIEDEVFHAGFHAESSFGAAPYFIRRPAAKGGNVLVDAPRFAGPLVRRLEELGGVAILFLTHVDDVADHARFAAHFGCRRIMHADDAVEGIETVFEGLEPLRIDDDLLAIPTPGHTRGSACLLHRGRFLFTGDHLAWSPGRGRLYAFRDACWFDWPTQIASMERLSAYDFTWVLPGHGRRTRLADGASKAEVARCVAWMKSA
jgi:glyoxylase-like metal-dependent hydrolase (beta-lactamase superfamily II)/ferredoxin